MSELYLTESQLDELSGMGVAGAAVRKSAELVAAAVFWELKLLRNEIQRQEASHTLIVGSEKYNEHMDDLGEVMFECNDKLAAIGKALEEAE